MLILCVLVVYTYINKYVINDKTQLINIPESVSVEVLSTPIPQITPEIITAIPTVLPEITIEPLPTTLSPKPTDIPVVIVKTPTVKVSRSDVTRPVIKPITSTKVDFKYVDTFTGNITMYTLSYASCGKYPSHSEYGITASGKYVTEHKTIAMSKSIPFGSKVKIEGFNEIFTVEDRGGAITGLCVDVFTYSEKEAMKWGRQKRQVWVIEYGNGKVK